MHLSRNLDEGPRENQEELSNKFARTHDEKWIGQTVLAGKSGLPLLPNAVMLSGETSTGRYPVECVQVLHRVAMRIERSGGAGYAKSVILEDARQKTVSSAVVLANSLRRAKLIVFTRHGTMARNVSNLRPDNAPIFAFTPSEVVRRQLAICWGVYPVRIDFDDDPAVTIHTAEEFLRSHNLTNAGDHLVIISDIRVDSDRIDSVQLRTAK